MARLRRSDAFIGFFRSCTVSGRHLPPSRSVSSSASLASPLADAPGESGLRKEKEDPRHAATGTGSHELRRQAYFFSCRLCGREQKSPVNTGRNASEKVTREAYFRVSYARVEKVTRKVTRVTRKVTRKGTRVTRKGTRVTPKLRELRQSYARCYASSSSCLWQ